MQIQLGDDGKAKWKQGWYVVGDKRYYFRSNWERRYALYLEILKRHGEISDWQYEPDTFWFDKIKRGVRSYKPDFKVTHKNGSIEYIEVKGYMDSKSATKIKRMRIYHPTVVIRLVQREWFSQNAKALKALCKDW